MKSNQEGLTDAQQQQLRAQSKNNTPSQANQTQSKTTQEANVPQGTNPTQRQLSQQKPKVNAQQEEESKVTSVVTADTAQKVEEKIIVQPEQNIPKKIQETVPSTKQDKRVKFETDKPRSTNQQSNQDIFEAQLRDSMMPGSTGNAIQLQDLRGYPVNQGPTQPASTLNQYQALYNQDIVRMSHSDLSNFQANQLNQSISSQSSSMQSQFYLPNNIPVGGIIDSQVDQAKQNGERRDQSKDTELMRHQQLYMREQEYQQRYKNYLNNLPTGDEKDGQSIVKQNMLQDGLNDQMLLGYSPSQMKLLIQARNQSLINSNQKQKPATTQELNEVSKPEDSRVLSPSNLSFGQDQTQNSGNNAISRPKNEVTNNQQEQSTGVHSTMSFNNDTNVQSIQNPIASQPPNLSPQQIFLLQQSQVLRNQNHSSISQSQQPDRAAAAFPSIGSISQYNHFNQAAMHQQIQIQNPNHNEVMSLDPIDGRDIRGRGRSRDTSNSRILGVVNQNSLMGSFTHQNMQGSLGNSGLLMQGMRNNYMNYMTNPQLASSANINHQNMDINDMQLNHQNFSQMQAQNSHIQMRSPALSEIQQFMPSGGIDPNISPAALIAMNSQAQGNKPIPIFCSLHGQPLDFYCFDDQQRICVECLNLMHANHKVDYIISFLTGNQKSLQFVQQKAKMLHQQRQEIHDVTYRQFKRQIRTEVLNLKKQSVQAIEEASSRILQLINKGQMRNFEKEMEIYQNFVNNKIINFQLRISQAMDQNNKQAQQSPPTASRDLVMRGSSASGQNQIQNPGSNVQTGLIRHQAQVLGMDKEKLESFEKEVVSISEQIKFKKEYFEKIQDKILNKIDLSSFQQIKIKIQQAERSLEQYSKDNRIAVFVPNRKQIIMHDLKYFTSKTIDLKQIEHPFGNFSTILQCSMNGKIYICGGKQRKKLFEFDERNWTLIERSEMINGRSNHAFVEVPLTGELVAIGGWDGERAMAQTEGFSIRTNQWKQLPKLAEERHSLTACLLGQSFIYAIGGSSAINYGSSLCTIERINFAQPNFMQLQTWELIYLNGEFQDQKRSQLGSIAITDDQIMIFGGFLDTDLTNQCYIIDHNRQSIQKMKKQPRIQRSSAAHRNDQAQVRLGPSAQNGQDGANGLVQGADNANRASRGVAGRSIERGPDLRSNPIDSNRADRGGYSLQRNNSNQPGSQNIEAALVEGEPAAEELDLQASAAASNGDQFVTMKKSKKFIKFKDFIIKLPNSTGLTGSRNNTLNLLNNDQGPFVDIQGNAGNDVEGPDALQNNLNGLQGGSNSSYWNEQLNQSMGRMNDKGYSIYVVDDEHEIHRFDLDTYEWTIISTTKDQD